MLAVFGGAFCGVVIAILSSGCTPAQQATASNATVTGAKIAACVQGVLAEEERARMLERRLAEEQAELEAQKLKDEAEAKAEADTKRPIDEQDPYRAPSTTAQEVDKVLRDGGVQ